MRPEHLIARGNHLEAQWYESFFTALALDFWQAAVPPTATAAEVDFLVRELGVVPPARVLDLPSGSGRHALALAKRGYSMTGIDISPCAIVSAQRQAEIAGVSAAFLLGDMRKPPAQGPYAGAYCFGNSFGYLSREDMEGFVVDMLGAVVPGGRWVIDTGAAAESLLPHFIEERVLEAGGVTYAVRSRFDSEARRLVQSCKLARGSELQTAEIYYSIYTVQELHQLLARHGWLVLSTYSSPEGAPFQPGDRRLLLVAERPIQP
jgi:SAM-dependent methyltransferase